MSEYLSGIPEDQALRERVAAVHAFAEKASATSALSYLQCLTIDASPDPAPFRQLAQDWQWALAQRFVPLFEHVAGIRLGYKGPYNHWLGLPKGHDKSSMLGRFCNYALAFSKRAWSGYVYAEDRDQAALVVEAMTREARLNPWLQKRLQFKNNRVLGQNDSCLRVEPADAASAQGPRPDLIIADELVHWSTDEVWKVIVSSLRKRRGCAFAVLTNAGTKYTWQWDVHEFARTSPEWSFYEAPHRLATWMDEAAIEQDRKLLPPAMAARLFDNAWVEPGMENGYVTRAEAQACADLGKERGLMQVHRGVDNIPYFGAVDFGSTKDRCVCVLGHRDGDTLLVDQMAVWQGSRSSPVPVARVEAWLDRVRKEFNLACVVVDPHQMQFLLEKYARHVPMEKWEARAGRANYEMAEVLRTLIVNRKVAWPPDCGTIYGMGRPHTLVDELSELIVQPYANGTSYRMQHLPKGHDDRCLVAGTLIETLSGRLPIEEVSVGDKALTRVGYKPVIASGLTGLHCVYEVLFGNGERLVGTANHPVLTARGWKGLGHLQPGDVAYSCPPSSTGGDALTPVRIVRVRRLREMPVFNLSVADQPEYFANGILVHNCVALAMMAVAATKVTPRQPLYLSDIFF